MCDVINAWALRVWKESLSRDELSAQNKLVTTWQRFLVERSEADVVESWIKNLLIKQNIKFDLAHYYKRLNLFLSGLETQLVCFHLKNMSYKLKCAKNDQNLSIKSLDSACITEMKDLLRKQMSLKLLVMICLSVFCQLFVHWIKSLLCVNSPLGKNKIISYE